MNKMPDLQTQHTGPGKGKAWFVGGGIGSLAAAAFMIRDGNFPAAHITIFEAAGVCGGSLDGAGNPEHGYSLRGGRMLTTDKFVRHHGTTLPSSRNQ